VPAAIASPMASAPGTNHSPLCFPMSILLVAGEDRTTAVVEIQKHGCCRAGAGSFIRKCGPNVWFLQAPVTNAAGASDTRATKFPDVGLIAAM
jgi:hypothetical protein